MMTTENTLVTTFMTIMTVLGSIVIIKDVGKAILYIIETIADMEPCKRQRTIISTIRWTVFMVAGIIVVSALSHSFIENMHGLIDKFPKEDELHMTESKGYAVTDFDGTGMLEIQKIDEQDVFPDDEAAVDAAIRDGVKIIPVEELPNNFPRRYLGWIDTPENRKNIQDYCNKL